MSPATASVAKDRWSDLFASLDFVERRFADWGATGVLSIALAGRHPDLLVPPPISIARFLIERWVARSEDR